MAAFFLLVSLHTHPVDFEPTTLSSTLFYGWKEVSFEPKFIGKKKKMTYHRCQEHLVYKSPFLSIRGYSYVSHLSKSLRHLISRKTT